MIIVQTNLSMNFHNMNELFKSNIQGTFIMLV